MATSITCLVAVKVSRGMLLTRFNLVSGVRRWAFVAVVRMEMVVYVAMEVSGAVKPWTGADKDSADKPLRAVISIRCAPIRRGVICQGLFEWFP